MFKRIRLASFITTITLAFIAVSSVVIAVSENKINIYKKSDEAKILKLTDEFQISREELQIEKGKAITWGKVAYKLICDKKIAAKTDKTVKALYQKGYSFQDIDVAYDLSVISGIDVERILETKGKSERYKLTYETDAKGKEIEIVVDMNDQLWEAAIQKLDIDLDRYIALLEVPESSLKKTSSNRITKKQAYDMAMLAYCYDLSYAEVYEQVVSGKKIREVENKYLHERMKTNAKSTNEWKPEVDSQENRERAIKMAYEITDIEINMFKNNGISDITDIAKAKHLSSNYGKPVEEIVQKKKELKEWIKVETELGGEK